MSANSGSFDTNILARLILNDVPNQTADIEELMSKEKGIFEVPDASIIVLAFILSRYYGFSRADIADSILVLLNETNIRGNVQIFKDTTDLYTVKSSLSFEDCYLAAHAKHYNALPLWTFDKKLASQAPSAKLVPVIL